MATPTLRLFIAMPIPAVVRAEIAVVQDALRRGLTATGVKWTRPDQFHLTLRFLGDVEEARVPELMAALRSACDLTPSMELIAERLGVSAPSVSAGRVGVGARRRGRADRVAGADREGGRAVRRSRAGCSHQSVVRAADLRAVTRCVVGTAIAAWCMP